MSFAIPTTDPTAIRCHAIIDRLVKQPVGSMMHDEGWRHGSDWITQAEGLRHFHPTIAFEGDAIIRALVEDPANAEWLAQGIKWLTQFESARRIQHRPTIHLPECRDTADLIRANID